MREVIEFFVECARSGSLLTSLCGIVLLPLGAWLACRLIAPAIVRMSDDPAWQAPLAAVAAGLPGAMFVGLWSGSVLGGLGSACLSLPAGRFVFSVLIAAMIGALTRATWLAIARALGIRRLIRSSSDPSPRLRAIADASMVRTRELRDRAPVCALAGVISPAVLVSTGALALISDEELRAALHHERAHLLHGDQMLAAACSFLVDLLPLPAADLVDAYRTARELAADQDAARATNAEALAGALIEFAKGHRVIAEAACLIDGRASATTQRLRVLLGKTASGRRVDPYRRVALALALAAIFIAGVITPTMASQHAASCTIAMKASR